MKEIQGPSAEFELQSQVQLEERPDDYEIEIDELGGDKY